MSHRTSSITLGAAIAAGEGPIGELLGFLDAPHLSLYLLLPSLTLIPKFSVSKDTAGWTSASFVLHSQILLYQLSSWILDFADMVCHGNPPLCVARIFDHLA